MRYLALALLLAAAPAAAQVDPSNPSGAPPAPNLAPTSKPEQGTVIRNAAPGKDLDPRQQPLPPSATAGVEEAQRTGPTKPEKGTPNSPSADPAPIDRPSAPRAADKDRP